MYLKERPIDIDLNYSELSNHTGNYVSSDIKFIVDEASRVALIDKTRISEKILLDVINQTKPSVSLIEIIRYKNMQKNLKDKY